ncbi:cystatin-like protein [Pseudorasbora parva]|uniref:cystatin-like protein n=1 Tax=Pseudorasbora parva TaxID=51549 RepID=UPI00351DD3B0
MRGLLLLLSALVLLESTDGNQQYDQLSQHDREIIDRAIEKANKEHGHAKHLDFVSIPDVNPYKQMLHVLLKPTSCDKMTKSVHQKDCVIKNKAKPQVYCVECRRSMSCFLLKDTEKMRGWDILSSAQALVERAHQFDNSQVTVYFGSNSACFITVEMSCYKC